MNPFEVISSFHFTELIYSSNDILIGKVKNLNIYFKISKSKEDCDSYKCCWYYNGTAEPDITDEIHLVDILDLVDEEASKQLIFNMGFLK
jgi:hypothetical protein